MADWIATVGVCSSGTTNLQHNKYKRPFFIVLPAIQATDFLDRNNHEFRSLATKNCQFEYYEVFFPVTDSSSHSGAKFLP